MRSFIVYDIDWDQADIDDTCQDDEASIHELYKQLPTSIVIGLPDDNASDAEIRSALEMAVEAHEGITVQGLQFDADFDIEPRYVYSPILLAA